MPNPVPTKSHMASSCLVKTKTNRPNLLLTKKLNASSTTSGMSFFNPNSSDCVPTSLPKLQQYNDYWNKKQTNEAKEDSFSSNQAINHESRLNMAINPSSYKLDSQSHILTTQNQGHYSQIGAINAPLIRSRGAEMSGLNYFSNKLNNRGQKPHAGSYIENPLGSTFPF